MIIVCRINDKKFIGTNRVKYSSKNPYLKKKIAFKLIQGFSPSCMTYILIYLFNSSDLNSHNRIILNGNLNGNYELKIKRY